MGYLYNMRTNSISYCTMDSIPASNTKWIMVNCNMKSLVDKYSIAYVTEDKKDIYIENLPKGVSDSLRNFYTAVIRKCEIGNRRAGSMTMADMTTLCTEYEDLQANHHDFHVKFGGRALGFMDICEIQCMYRIPGDGLFMVVWRNEPKSIYIMNGGIYDGRWNENSSSPISG